MMTSLTKFIILCSWENHEKNS